VKPKLIKTKEEHDAAVERIAKLMECDPRAGTPAGDELELLAHLVADYEKKHHSIGLPDPLTAIRFRMEQQGLRPKDLAPYLGGANRVSEVLAGKRALTVPMIHRLHHELGIPAEVLLKGRSKPTNRKSGSASVLSTRALKEMWKRGWFASFRGSLNQAKQKANQLLKRFFCFGTELDALPALARQKVHRDAIQDQFALLAWKTRVLQRAAAEKLDSEFDPAAFTPDFLKQVKSSSRLKNGPVVAIDLLNSNGLAVVIERHLPGTFLDGAALKLPDGRPVIGLTLRYDRLDYFWFCLFHELGHVLKHLAQGKREGFIDDLTAPCEDKCEEEADEFARGTLIPKDAWERFFKAGQFDHESVRREAKRLMIDASILAGRLRMERSDFQMLTSLVGNRKVRVLLESVAKLEPIRQRRDGNKDNNYGKEKTKKSNSSRNRRSASR
jgi:HTH-type transcriptional regulator/antitoxin HigA